jgi:hypothetical protein
VKKFLTLAFAIAFGASAYAQSSGTVTNHAFVIGKGPGVTGYTSLLCASGQLALGSATDPTCRTMSGDATLSATGVFTLGTVNANVGTFGSATQCITTTQNAKGLTTAISAANCTPPIGSVTGLGTGIAAALGDNIGSAGAPVVFGGALGTPSSGTGTNITGIPFVNLTGLPTTLAGHGITSPLPIAQGGTAGTTQQTALDGVMPAGVNPGDLVFWNGTHWIDFNGNTSGTKVLQETSAGVLSWITAAGTGTVTQVTCGGGLSGGTFTTTGTCAINNFVAVSNWTPTDASGAGLTFTSVTAKYSVSNNVVTAQFRLTFPTTVNASTISIGGLPVATNSTGGSFVTNGLCFSGASSPNSLLLTSSAQNTTTFQPQGGTGLSPTNANLSTFVMSCMLTYLTN